MDEQKGASYPDSLFIARDAQEQALLDAHPEVCGYCHERIFNVINVHHLEEMEVPFIGDIPHHTDCWQIVNMERRRLARGGAPYTPHPSSW